jgi:hypothetical protein
MSIGVPSGTMRSEEDPRIEVGAGRTRWNVTVPAPSSATTPRDRSHVSGSLGVHVDPPTSSGKRLASSLYFFPVSTRSKLATPSWGVTRWPFEKLIPWRSVNVYARPSGVGSGSDTARSGTTVKAAAPPARRYVTVPS